MPYADFISLELQHSYYSDGLCQGLTVVPSAETQTLLRKRGMMFTSGDHGCQILGTQDADGNWKRMGSDFVLTLYLQMEDRQFRGITELGYDWDQDEAIFLDNVSHLVAGTPYTYLDDGAQRVYLSGTSFEIDLGQPLTQTATVSLKDADDNACEVTDRLGVGFSNNELPVGTQYFRADLSDRTLGRFSLAVSGGATLQQELVTQDLGAGAKALAVVQFFVTADMTGSSSAAPYEYELGFSSRTTTWRYIMSEDPGTEIVPEVNATTVFSKVDVDGQTAYAADTQLTLAEAYSYTFTLLKSGEFYQYLPYPVPSGLVPADGGIVYADMYVQL